MLEADYREFVHCHLISDLPADDIEAAVSQLHPIVAEFPSGTNIFRSNDFSPSLIYIISGEVVVEKNECGKNVLLNHLHAGDCFGVAAMYGEVSDYPTRVYTRTAVRIAAIDESGLTALFQAYPAAAISHIRFLSDRIRFLNKKISALTGRDTESKVSNYILRTYGKQTLHKKLNMAETSRLLDMGRASLYRIIGQLNDKGIIKYQNGYIEILNKKELERLSK